MSNGPRHLPAPPTPGALQPGDRQRPRGIPEGAWLAVWWIDSVAAVVLLSMAMLGMVLCHAFEGPPCALGERLAMLPGLAPLAAPAVGYTAVVLILGRLQARSRLALVAYGVLAVAHPVLAGVVIAGSLGLPGAEWGILAALWICVPGAALGWDVATRLRQSRSPSG